MEMAHSGFIGRGLASDQWLTGEETHGCENLAEIIDAVIDALIFHADAHPNVLSQILVSCFVVVDYCPYTC